MTQTLHHTDHQLRTAIQRELEWTPEIDADQIGIAVTDGAVTLSGVVATYLEKTAALKACRRVKGVVGVADEITVEHRFGPRADIDIAREATKALAASMVVPDDAVQVTVHDGHVTLTGAVPWHYQREAATRAVSRVTGVTSVSNAVTLKPRLPFAAAAARTRITDALVRNAQTDAQAITIDVEGSEITLTGTVRSWAERGQAAWAAWSTPGVTNVHNDLRVRT